MRVYPNLVQTMDTQKVSVSDLAKTLGMSRSTLSRRLNGWSDFLLTEAVKISQVLGVDNLAWLFLRLDTKI